MPRRNLLTAAQREELLAFPTNEIDLIRALLAAEEPDLYQAEASLAPLKRDLLVLALSSVQVRLKDVEEDIEQVILKPEILVGNEGNQMQVAVFAGPSCHLEDLRLDDTVGIVPNPLMIEVECAEYRQEVSIQALHD